MSPRTAARERTWSVLLIQALVAVASGAVVQLGFAPIGWWALAPLGFAGLVWAVRRSSSLRAAIGNGWCFGLGLAGSTLTWVAALDVGGAIGLIPVMSAWYALLGAMLRWSGRLAAWPVLGACSLVAVEAASGRFPLGGFGWLRLGYALVDSPAADVLPVLGVAGLGFAGALAGAGIVWVVERPDRARLLWAGVATAALAGCGAVGASIGPGRQTGELSVGWAQGGAPGGGLTGLGPARTITANQLAETRARAAALSEPPDFWVWPENATDLDPRTDAETRAMVEAALAAAGRPILVGSILVESDSDTRRTVSQWWTPDGRVGPTYQKRSIVPFGEWIPFRDVLLPLAPVLEHVGAQSIAGKEPGLMGVELQNGRRARLGLLMCFDVAYDQVVRDIAPGDAMIVQSSNAMFNGTRQSAQQFAMTRARAAELRREMLVVTTSGKSGLIDPFGRTVFADEGPGAAGGVVQLPTRAGVTPVVWLGGWFELVVVAGSLVGVGVALARRASPSETGRRRASRPRGRSGQGASGRRRAGRAIRRRRTSWGWLAVRGLGSRQPRSGGNGLVALRPELAPGRHNGGFRR